MAKPAEKPRRPMFQLHLSTAIVLMFVAGGMLWANVRRRSSIGEPAGLEYSITLRNNSILENIDDSQHRFIDREWGWPANAFEINNQQRSKEVMASLYDLPDPTRWRIYGVLINFATAIAILAAATFICEWRIRRREARKT